MSFLKVLFASMLCGALLLSVPTAGAKSKKTTPKVKVFTMKTKATRVVAAKALGEYFQASALVKADCGKNYQPLAIGISSATNPLAAQDLGFVGMSAYASGQAGTARTKLQALCVRGGRPPFYTGRAVKLGANGMGTLVKATVSCNKGYVALGAALAHGHAPAFGSYTSMPDGKRRWSYSAQLPSSVAGQLGDKASQLGYPRVACVKATAVTTKEFKGEVTPAQRRRARSPARAAACSAGASRWVRAAAGRAATAAGRSRRSSAPSSPARGRCPSASSVTPAATPVPPRSAPRSSAASCPRASRGRHMDRHKPITRNALVPH